MNVSEIIMIFLLIFFMTLVIHFSLIKLNIGLINKNLNKIKKLISFINVDDLRKLSKQIIYKERKNLEDDIKITNNFNEKKTSKRSLEFKNLLINLWKENITLYELYKNLNLLELDIIKKKEMYWFLNQILEIHFFRKIQNDIWD